MLPFLENSPRTAMILGAALSGGDALWMAQQMVDQEEPDEQDDETNERG